MTPKRLVAITVLFLFTVGLAVAQGPRRNVGTGIPLPPIEEEDETDQPRDADDQFALSIDVELVQVDVVVTDRSGNPVSGLEKEHFTVYVDDVEQKVTNFSPTDSPMTVVLVIEFGDTIGYYYDDVVRPAAGFIQSLREEDWGAIIAYDMRPTILTDFTQSQQEMFGGLQRLRYPAYRELSLYDAVAFTLERMANIDGKKAMFLLSTGFDTISKISYPKTLKLAEASDTTIYSVGMAQAFRMRYADRMGGLTSLGFLQAENVLRSLANATGGSYFFPKFAGEYNGIYDLVSAQMRNQYSIGFVPVDVKQDDKLRKIKVEVPEMDVDHDGDMDKLRVRHKKGFYVIDPE